MSTQHEPEDAFESIRRLKELRQLIDNAIQQMQVGAMKYDPDGCDRLVKARGVEGYDWLLGDYAIKWLDTMHRFKRVCPTSSGSVPSKVGEGS